MKILKIKGVSANRVKPEKRLRAELKPLIKNIIIAPGLNFPNRIERTKMLAFIIDSREQAPYTFERYLVTVDRAGLPAGDYSLIGFEDRVAIERKTLDDLISCLMGKDRERFERELPKLRAYELAAVVIEANLQDIANGRFQSKMTPKSAIQSITAFYIRYGVPFLFCGDRIGGEYMTYSLLSKYMYEIDKRYKQALKANARN